MLGRASVLAQTAAHCHHRRIPKASRPPHRLPRLPATPITRRRRRHRRSRPRRSPRTGRPRLRDASRVQRLRPRRHRPTTPTPPKDRELRLALIRRLRTSLHHQPHPLQATPHTLLKQVGLNYAAASLGALIVPLETMACSRAEPNESRRHRHQHHHRSQHRPDVDHPTNQNRKLRREKRSRRLGRRHVQEFHDAASPVPPENHRLARKRRPFPSSIPTQAPDSASPTMTGTLPSPLHQPVGQL